MKTLLSLLFAALSAVHAVAQGFDYTSIAEHPRILLRAGETTRIGTAVEKEPILAYVHERIMAFCRQTLGQPPVVYHKEGRRLLAVSRTALKRIYYLAYAYRMTGDERYAARARKEMLAASAFADWNPTHFLDVGEMVMALAIGYDWLYGYLDPETKTIVRRAIMEKGFDASRDETNAWFYRAVNNWNQVCNAGLVFGALAIFDEAPEASRHVIERCLETNPRAMACYAPDGGYPEGVHYWGYGTSFEILLVAAFESAFGSDAGLSKTRGFLRSARFVRHLTGPTGTSFNYGDTPEAAPCNMMMFWCAEKLGDPSVLWLEKQRLDKREVRFAEDRLLPSLMIFASGIDFRTIRPPKERFWYNRGETPVFTYRSGWESPDDAYLAVKGGSARTPHAHMDAGSFVYDYMGQRWAADLGMQSYITLESKGVDLWNKAQNSQRWEVFRIGNTSHNTLTLNGQRHDVRGFAPIRKVYRRAGKKGVRIDMTQLFAGTTPEATRTVTLDRNELLHVEDRIVARDSAIRVTWRMTTPARAVIADTACIRLEQNGKRMRMRIDADTEVAMRIWTNDPPHAYDAPNPGTVRVGFEARIAPFSTRTFRVTLCPEP